MGSEAINSVLSSRGPIHHGDTEDGHGHILVPMEGDLADPDVLVAVWFMTVLYSSLSSAGLMAFSSTESVDIEFGAGVVVDILVANQRTRGYSWFLAIGSSQQALVMASTEELRRNLIIIVRLAVAARWRVIERRLRDLRAVFRAKPTLSLYRVIIRKTGPEWHMQPYSAGGRPPTHGSALAVKGSELVKILA